MRPPAQPPSGELPTEIVDASVTIVGPVEEVRALASALDRADRFRAGPQGRGSIQFTLIRPFAEQEHATEQLRSWLKRHVGALGAIEGRKEIWFNVLFVTGGSQWVVLDPELMGLCARAGVTLIPQFALVVRD